MNRIDSRAFSWVLLVVAALLTATGCGGPKGPARYELQGAVQYDGQPVAAGEVFLQPDASRGNAGPGSLALIEKGRYKTAPDKGVVGGPYTVQILGFDGVPAGDSTAGKSLFPKYVIQVEFPKQAGTHDFNIPRVDKFGP